VPLRWASVAVLVVIAVRGLVAVRREMAATAIPVGAPSGVPDPEATARHRAAAAYLRFLGLTIVNPSTVVYFAALVVGLPAVSGGAAERIVFAVGAFIASISWQSLLAVIGAVVHRRLPPSARLYTSLAGNLIVLALAANILRGLLA
jgi:arginine exporter protein ArgO